MSIGFIILRHVNSKITDAYWKLCYESIVKFYQDSNILIIDDNSNYDFVDQDYEKELKNTTIINSEYKGSGELLPYIYYIKYKHADVACIIHDSVFVNKYIDLNTETYSILWNFDHYWDQPEDEKKIINSLNNNIKLLKFHANKKLWTGCFGGMSVINYNFLKTLDNKYNFQNMVPHIKTRYNRQSFERVIAAILQLNSNNNGIVFGNIHEYCRWGITYNEITKYSHLPFIKVWTGR
jgi:hypothetical protein